MPWDRTSGHRQEWAIAGDHATGMGRFLLSIRLDQRRVEHAAAEGIAYV